MSTRCPACFHDNLTVTGFSQHLAKSRNPHCQALYCQSHSQIHANDPYYEPDTDGVYGQDDLEFAQADDLEFVWEQISGHDDADDDASDDGLNAEPEWEPPVEAVEEDNGSSMDDPKIQARAQGLRGCVVMPYPDPRAGEQIANQANHHAANVEYGAHFANTEQENLYHPFTCKMDWEVARWAKLHGVSSTAFSDLLAIEGVSECLSLSFKNAKELNALVDHELLSSHPKFKREQIVVAGEAFDVYYHDVIECVRSLYGDPDFAKYLAFAPEWHYSDKDKTVRLFHDMHTGKWWWDTQKKLDQHSPGGTIIPIIISSDKTQVTLFRNKSVYPVYLTIGNIPKEIRCKPSRGAHILLAYLPCTQLEHITNKASCR
ncbi:uncharacterized protein F5891DRAFT_1193360 [Suillus fuscotomentosus]|uniref:Transposase n=1 Tax=Suillus fuscotomentosus TaxID=1912939 RepID=A0AAD4HGX1_9AGAM|nr:uncharacterized protein F5891DRAFT_1193360 [Suillus fuscotomentosus]KAG1896128.1 hypothetical protein F5891DRAFT_1193360 [Suillus fuscotomentosus]